MSKPAPPSRVPSAPIPPTARKSSQPAVNKVNAGAAPRFYDGPTVNAQGNDLKGQAKQAAAETVAVTKASTKKAVSTVRRHPLSIASILSILSTLPVLIFFSLASTVLCPPPGETLSPINRYVLSPLGYGPTSSHPILCYPSNVYHRDVLQPYVYPVLDKAQNRFENSPYYLNFAKPTYQRVESISKGIYNGPVKPVLNRTNRGIKKFYYKFIQPHLPYLKAKYNEITTPYTTRIHSFTKPHIETINAYSKLGSDNAIKGYNYAATHPITGQISKYAQKGFKLTSRNANKAYLWSKPHALRVRLEIERITREILGPRAVAAIQRGIVEGAKIEASVRTYIIQIYKTHLEPHVGPYITKTSTIISPYTSLFHKHIHQPYIQPTVHHFFPPSVESKSFLTMLSEFLPTSSGTSSHVAEKKGQMDDYYNDLENSRKPSDVKVPQANKVAEKKDKSSEKQPVGGKKVQTKIEKAEMDRVRNAIKSRVDGQGKISEKKVKEEVKRINTEFSSNQLPKLTENLRSEMEREIEYISKGLDKLYTTSTTLTKEQILKSSEQADLRLKRTIDKVRNRLELQKNKILDQQKVVVDKQFSLIDKALGGEYEELSQQMAYIDGVTTKDWDKYNDVKKLAESYKTKLSSSFNDPTLALPFNELKTELNDFHGSFRERIAILKRTAIDRIKAREAMSAEPSRVSILPIKEAAGAAAAVAGVGAGGILGKGKEQVLSALSAAGTPVSSASSSVSASALSAAGYAEQAKLSAQSILDNASSNLHEGTRSIISAVGATPSPESPREHVESVINVASEGIESFLDEATSSVSQATRSIKKAVGVTPTPESIPEHAESAYAAAAEAIESLSSAAESVLHQATRSAVSAVGGTPSPESPQEYAESIFNAAGQGINSAVSSASEVIHQGTRSVISAVGATPSPETFGESIESVIAVASEGMNNVIPDLNDVSKSIHSATRAAIKAVGATPSPENLGEHVESLSYIASESASSVISLASEAISGLSQDASSILHEATRSAVSVVGATPSPETPNEYLESIGNVVAEGAASIYGIAEENVNSIYSDASSNLHQGTRSAMKAIGVAPTPESLGEHVESIYNEASSTVSSVGSVVSDQASSLVNQIQEALGLITTTTTDSGIIASATSYLSSIALAGSSVGSEALVSGSSILNSLQNQASTSIHSATRAASRVVGATPTPETPSEYFDAAKEVVKEQVERIRSPREIAESLVRKHASQIDRDLADERARGTTRFIGDEHGHGHAHTRGVDEHHHAGREEL